MSDNEFGNRANIIRLNGVRIAPRKLRVLVDMIRHMDVQEAITVLQYSERRAGVPLAKLLESGVANIRESIPDWNIDDLVVASAWVNEGPTMRRFRPRARGMASRIRKRTSQVTVELRPAED
ncbi:MAG: 50S ribosomal protein L22 [Deltaproteobacteria bacterium]|nr:MAG: 50S ribosomal protein L22 [Deltaproteobacteria bacterium]